ncbi:MAG: glutamate racemase [Candidatus Faecousia sp.]|nr:glutamate racemase [Candidatus Faecousia sp.]
MNTKQDYIAVFDSGVGGISVLRHLRRQLPGERFVYYGDSANAPYGSRPTEEVRALTLAAVERLKAEYPLKALVIACNTATAAAINDVRSAFPELIVVGIEPALKVAADHYPGGRVGVLATEVTLREEKFDTLLHRFDEEVTIFKIPAPGLVELVEAGKVDTPETEALLRRVLQPYLGKLDALVLGCTHYPFARAAISRVLGDSVVLLDGGEGTARETRRRLRQAGLLENGEGQIIIRNSSPDPEMLRLSRERLEQED